MGDNKTKALSKNNVFKLVTLKRMRGDEKLEILLPKQ